MCFHNLPITFDGQGKAALSPEGWVDAPKGIDVSPPALKGDHQIHWDVDPVTRIAGAMEFFASVDLKERRVIDGRASASVFRGYEVILKGKEPVDAMDISSRACGVCGGVHSTTSSMGLDMAVPIGPPPLGIIARNIAQGCEFLYDHALHLCLLAGPDYSQSIVQACYAQQWSKAKSTRTRYEKIHGFKTIADLMEGLNPLKGSLYLEAIGQTRIALDMVSAMVGRYPHPTTLVPGGINMLLEPSNFKRVEDGLKKLLDFVKKVILVYEDLLSFLENADPRMKEVGSRKTVDLLCYGRYDDPMIYDGSWERMDEWGIARMIPPAAIINGELRTTKLSQINLGHEEFVEHSYYEEWGSHDIPADPHGSPLSPYHPWNKQTIPKPTEQNWRERYTWATSPRWDRVAVEAGPIARHWAMALAGKPWESHLIPDGKGFTYTLPKGNLPGLRLRWNIPDRVNAIERNRARAHHLGVTWLACWIQMKKGFEILKTNPAVWKPHAIPDEGIGVGFWEAARGALGHWMTIKGKKIDNYQIITPSSFNVAPRDPWGNPGPYEETAMNTPILEDFSKKEDFKGIDILRALRSFDPCMPCAVHMIDGDHKVSKGLNSCPCGLDQ